MNSMTAYPRVFPTYFNFRRATLLFVPVLKSNGEPRKLASTPAALPSVKDSGPVISNDSVEPAFMSREISTLLLARLISTHESSRSFSTKPSLAALG
jgi:hypothetical protein